MQLSKFVVLSVTALLSATGEACKCYGTKGNLNNGATHKCCNDYHGVYSGNDCKASSISEHLSGFDRCCKGQGSDCDFPGRAAALVNYRRRVEIATKTWGNREYGVAKRDWTILAVFPLNQALLLPPGRSLELFQRLDLIQIVDTS
ncbi:hypothetical protein FOVSG1_012201 [Fusarium oxysporum f. sp. vasinfectum]